MSNENNLPCKIVQDLLPLYHDGVTSGITGQAIEAHLAQCDGCARELALLRENLPVKAEERATKTRFTAMIQGEKRRQLLRVVTAAVATCVALISALYVLTQIPLVPIPASEFNVHSVYRYEMDGSEHFFVMYTHPLYGAPTTGRFVTEEKENGGDQTFLVKWRKPVLTRKIRDAGNEEVLLTFFAPGLFDTLKFNDTVVWSEEANGNDPVPEYFYAYAERAKGERGVSYDLDFEKNMIRIHSGSGRIREWDLQGNLLYDSDLEMPQ